MKVTFRNIERVLVVVAISICVPCWTYMGAIRLGTHSVRQPEDWSRKRPVFEDGHIIMVPPSINWTELVAAPSGLWIQRGSNAFYLLTTNVVWQDGKVREK